MLDPLQICAITILFVWGFIWAFHRLHTKAGQHTIKFQEIKAPINCIRRQDTWQRGKWQRTEYYNKDGQRHRENGPAVEYANGYKAWYLNGKLHRTGGPAIEWANGTKSWWINGKLHHIECRNKDGQLHRTDGPAVEYANGEKEWWLNGKRVLASKMDSIHNPHERLFSFYIDNLFAYIKGEMIRNPYTGVDEYPNEKLMRGVEEKIAIAERHVEDFRRTIAAVYGAAVHSGIHPTWESNPTLAKAIRLKVEDDANHSFSEFAAQPTVV